MIMMIKLVLCQTFLMSSAFKKEELTQSSAELHRVTQRNNTVQSTIFINFDKISVHGKIYM